MASIAFEILAGMMHELRTPLGPIGGYTELLQMGVHGEVNENQNDLLQRIKVNQRRMVALMDAFMSYAETASGKRTVRFERISLAQSANRVVDRHKNEFQKRSIEVKVSFADDSEVIADAALLELLLNELMQDALGTMRDNGSVEIIGDGHGGSSISVEFSSSSEIAEPSTSELMFEPFSRESKAGMTSACLHSLSLPHAKALALLLNCHLSGVSTSHRRVFRLDLPRARGT